MLCSLLAAGCGGDDSGGGNEVDAGYDGGAGLDAFCAEMARLDSERPEAYVGTDEHVAEIEGLLAVSPREVRGDVETFRDFLASGGVDPDDSATKLTRNWPQPVQDAITGITGYAAEQC